jgi:cell pole-organizing protein PopZ
VHQIYRRGVLDADSADVERLRAALMRLSRAGELRPPFSLTQPAAPECLRPMLRDWIDRNMTRLLHTALSARLQDAVQQSQQNAGNDFSRNELPEVCR